MDRRRFLKLLGLSAPAIVAPTYFLAPKGGWHKASSGLYSRHNFPLDTLWVADIDHGPYDTYSLSRQYNRYVEPLNAEMIRRVAARLVSIYA